jgi:hypothetical protein
MGEVEQRGGWRGVEAVDVNYGEQWDGEAYHFGGLEG